MRFVRYDAPLAVIIHAQFFEVVIHVQNLRQASEDTKTVLWRNTEYSYRFVKPRLKGDGSFDSNMQHFILLNHHLGPHLVQQAPDCVVRLDFERFGALPPCTC